MEALSDYVIIKRKEKEEVSEGGLYLAPNATDKELVTSGTILSIGPGAHSPTGTYVETTLKPGQVVHFNLRDCIVAELLGDEVHILREKNLIAKV